MTVTEIVLAVLIGGLCVLYLLNIRRVRKLETKVTRASNLAIEAIARAEVNELFNKFSKTMIDKALKEIIDVQRKEQQKS